MPSAPRAGRYASTIEEHPGELARRVRSGPRTVRVAMVGTFDVENLGDLLFPVVAHHALSSRVEALELELFSYRSLDPPSWPCKVRPVSTLAPRLGEFDLVLIGGGHIVRGDEGVAPGYAPADAVTSHPFGLWLTPTLLAEAAGVPVVWNAIGAIDTVPEALAPLVAAALAAADYVAVRDLPSARFVHGCAASAAPVVVPDTVFGIRGALTGEAAAAAAAALSAAGVGGPYVVVQPSVALEGYREAVGSIAASAAARSMSVVEVPIGPCHDDAAGRLELGVATSRLSTWPDPLVTAAILAGAEAVVASSLHAGIIATASGVPLVRPRAARDSKHEPLDVLPGVTELPADGEDAEVEVVFGADQPSSQVTGYAAVLEHHWDEVARRATGRGARGTRAPVAELVESLPEMLQHRKRVADEAVAEITAAGVTARRHDAEVLAALAERLADERERGDRLDEVVARRSVQFALRMADLSARWRRRGAGTPEHEG